ncbi:MAG TPA: uroporphyrinogen decarboxylase family protein [Candidatus Hydrogenedentes bacterium]|nr:uroporphyrinogen decarboxylase family protein [Candidatus Hydrogenedentota bacterium]
MSNTSKSRVLSALRCESVDPIPWVPYVGCHAAALIGVKACDYLKSEKLMLKGLETAIERYHPDGIPVGFDLQLEAEAMGCSLAWADDNPPAVVSHPLTEGVPLGRIPVPTTDAPRIQAVLSTARVLRANHPDIALYGLVCGPFTLALHLMGTEIFTDMFDDPKRIKDVMSFCSAVTRGMASNYANSGCDIIAVVDPMTSQISTEQFHEFVTPFIRPVFSDIRQWGLLSAFFVCGHAQHNIAAMCECGPNCVSFDENIPISYVRDICLPQGISFSGNIPLTSVLLLGMPDDARRGALECMESGGTTGFILAPGCDLPYATPPENLEAIAELLQNPYQREMLRVKTVLADTESPPPDLSRYAAPDRVIIDIFTLDSESCAPCQYMVKAIAEVAPAFEGAVQWQEHKIKKWESVHLMHALGVRNIPTVCIDGKIAFVSRIPAREELITAIRKQISEKQVAPSDRA